MTYAMSRFDSGALVEKKSLLELIHDSAKTTIVASSLANLVEQRRQKDKADRRAARAVKTVIERLSSNEVDETAEDSLLLKILNKITRVVGRKLFQYVVRPIINFAARMAMTIVRIALTSLVEYAIVPVIGAMSAFALANPITASIFLAAAATGGVYWIWNQFFNKEVKSPSTVEKAQLVTSTSSPNIISYIAEPIKYVKDTYNKVTGRKFVGFGEDVDSYIKEASAIYKLPEDILRGFIKMEAGWTGKMSPTGAIGAGQFIQTTWDSLARTADGKAIGMTVIGARFRTPDDPRFNKRINTLATALLAQNNAKILRSNRLPITGENLYMLHNIGPGIIPVMLGKPASESTLRAMQQNGMLAGQNAAQFLIWQKGRFTEQYQAANTRTAIVGDIAKMQDGMIVPTNAPVAVIKFPSDASNGTSTNGRVSDRLIVRGNGRTLVGINNV